MENKWENRIKDALEDFIIEEPEGLWTAVESGLKPSTPAFSPARAAGISLAVAASFALVGVFLFKVPEKSDESAHALALVEEIASEPAPAEASVASPELLALNGALQIASPAIGNSSGTSLATSSGETMLAEELDSPSESESAVSVAEAEKEEGREVPETLVAAAEEEGKVLFEEFATSENYANRERTSRLSLALAFAGVGGKSEEMSGYGGFNCSALVGAVSMRGEEKGEDRSYSAVLQDNIDKKVATEVKHRLPLQFAFTAEYKLSRRMGIESGLVYSRLVSELTSGTTESNYKTTQTLNYLGLPLSLDFSLAYSKFYRFYLSAGAMLEKCVSGKSVTDYYYAGVNHSSARESVSVRPLQCSAMASLGLEASLFGPAKLYFEPGLRYNFPTDTPVQTIYSERKMNFNLRCGLRFSF